MKPPLTIDTVVIGAREAGLAVSRWLQKHGVTHVVLERTRRYRGEDIFEWMQIAGLTEQRPQDLEDPNEVFAKQPQISGTRGGHTLSLQQPARDGVTLFGRLSDARGASLRFAGDLEANVAKGDEIAARLRAMVDAIIEKTGMDAHEAEPDPTEAPFAGIAEMAAVRELDVEDAGITSIIWATGFGPCLRSSVIRSRMLNPWLYRKGLNTSLP